MSNRIGTIAVCGAGVMGTQIAFWCASAGYECKLFDLPAKGDNKNALVERSIAHGSKIKPSPFATAKTLTRVQACNYEEHLPLIANCDLIIEAIGEQMDWKVALYEKIAPYISKHAIVASNTSGLSISELAHALPEELRPRFCGMHFFNPPRYMHLVELIATPETNKDLLAFLETWLTSMLGKGVIHAKDTPNFIANRIGVFSLLITMYYADVFQLGLDEVDALTGQLLGRPKSATFRTMDVVGLDTMRHVVKTMHDQLNQDPWHSFFNLPEWLNSLIDQGHLGQKTGKGIYCKKGNSIEVFDPYSLNYRPAIGTVSEAVKNIMQERDPRQRMRALQESDDKQAQFLVCCFRDLFHYCAYHLEQIANSVRDVDLAIRWGFGWQQGPFETWQTSGFEDFISAIKMAMEEGKAPVRAPLPEWLGRIEQFYNQDGAFSPAAMGFIPRSTLPVYKKQFFPERVLAEKPRQLELLFENAGIALYRFEANIGIISFKTKANTIGQSVLDGLSLALDKAEEQLDGLIIYQQDPATFSAGADLRGVASLIAANDYNALEKMISDFQQICLRIKYNRLPIVAALRGKALGGGCELMMHCTSIVAAFESYPGLVELGVGLIPAGGGCKEMALRAANVAGSGDLAREIGRYFEQIATAVVAGSAAEAKERGYLRAADYWVVNNHEVLYAALAQVQALLAANYLPNPPAEFKVAGREGYARLRAGLVNWLEGGFISRHDYHLAEQLAYVLCGGDVNEGAAVTEEWMLKREREAFIALAANPLTQARISHLLETGKPLRN